MASVLSTVGRTPRDQTRTRRLGQLLNVQQFGVDGQGLTLKDGDIKLKLKDASLVKDATGLGVQLSEGGGLDLAADGLEVIPPVREVPAGDMDASNVTFTLAHTPKTGSLMLFFNGVLMRLGASADYTLAGSTITFHTEPVADDKLYATYTKDTT